MTRKAYLAGGLRLRLTSTEPIDDAGYFPLFLTEDGPAPDVEIAVTRGALPAPRGDMILNTAHRRILRADGARIEYTCFSDSDHREHTPYACAVTRGTNVALTVDYPGRFWDTMIFDAVGLPDLFIGLGAPIVHAALIGDGKAGVLFAGPKQAGKSTQAALWHDCRGARILNGDRAVIRETPAGFFACGVPFCGSSRVCENADRLIRALVFPEKRERNLARRLAPFESFTRLIGCLSYTEADPIAQEAAVSLAERIAERLPCYVLECRPETEAVETLAAELGLPPSPADETAPEGGRP